VQPTVAAGTTGRIRGAGVVTDGAYSGGVDVRWVTASDGVKIAYSDTGTREADPLVLVHGLGLSSSIWQGLGYVRALNDHRVVTVDLRGHGRSGRPDGPHRYDMAQLADDVAAVLDELGLEAVTYVGYSLGARIGFSLLDRHPDRMRAFASLAGAHRLRAGEAEEIFYPGYRDTIEHEGMAGFTARWRAARPDIDAPTTLALSHNDPAVLLALLDVIDTDPGIPDQRLIDTAIPVLLVTGDEDGVGVRGALVAARLLPNAILVQLSGVGHTDILSRRDDLVSLITDLRRHGPTGARPGR